MKNSKCIYVCTYVLIHHLNLAAVAIVGAFYVCMYVCMYVFYVCNNVFYVCMYVCMYEYECMYMNVCICIYVCMT